MSCPQTVAVRRPPESRNGYSVSIFFVALLGATTSETSGDTPRDLLETRCRALQIFSGRFTEDIGCEFGADFGVQIFVAEFLVRMLARIIQMGVRILVRFFAEGAEPQNRAFSTKSNQNSDPHSDTFPNPGYGSGTGLGGGGDAGRSTAGSWLGAVEGNKAT